MSKPENKGLSLAYRVGYRIQMALMEIFGPAQLGAADDPQMRLKRRRQARVEAARAARLAREGSAS
ncbi:hypothetical protein N802_12865 [Knoellia sinensis KCTC 19936]|uniref:Uncharacterized protein n=1 Tax=Knoellia sinensis KCTC 19936 TaxID=1385520 RepID=A0A0A0JBQ8_9MICO|nr:hypothetical protein [Knoellia sinensis]KGN34249.1 hypothetical protein N802_12865 [Knoellia sinensis KCTC 19936]